MNITNAEEYQSLKIDSFTPNWLS